MTRNSSIYRADTNAAFRKATPMDVIEDALQCIKPQIQ